MGAPPIIPYVVGQWVRGDRFYGREAMLSELLAGPRESLWLLGTRRIGKTSLLRETELRASADTSGFLPLFWDFQGADEPRELHLSFHDAVLDAEESLDALGITPGSLDPEDLFSSISRIRRHLRATDKRLLLLCDEVEELIALNRQDPSLLPKLRRALQSGGEVRSVLTSTVRLWALADERGDTSPFLHGFAPPLYLSTMSADEAHALLHQEQLPKETQPAIDAAVVQTIARACDNHPYLLQLMGKRYLEEGDVQEALEQVATDEMVRYFFAVDFEMLSPVEQRILRALGEASAASSGSLEERLDLTSSEVIGGLLRLESLGFLRRNAKRQLELANAFFRRWLIELPAPRTDTRPRSTSGAGTQLDERYELRELIGEGATGLVYLAFDQLLETRIAVKILRAEYKDHPQILERFRQEIVLSRDLAHPNVLRVYHLGQADDRRYITMQWVDGPTLAQVIGEEGALSETVVRHVGIKLASALEAAHARKVIHRDIKPENVLLDRSGEPKLTDFGLARRLDDPGITSPGLFMGTPHYVSPEQATAAPLDERTDLYSLGVVLFEMATGRKPFEGETITEVLDQHRHRAPPDPREINERIGRDLSVLILRCLEKDRERRIPSAHELRSALLQIA
jgi:tRNA A-37 threonylcarbamoyl transferase component Bud32